MSRFKDGSFRKRGNKLEYRFMLDGKQRTVFGSSKDECYDKREALIREKSGSDDTPVTAREVLTLISSIGTGQSNAGGSTETLGSWLGSWFETYKRSHLKQHTVMAYERFIAGINAEDIAGAPLNELSGDMLQAFFNGISQVEKRRKYAMLIGPALKKAVLLRKLVYNPFDAVELPATKFTRRSAFTFDQQTQILSAVSGKYEAVFYVLTCTGMRIGEFLGLNYASDVDYDACTINIHGGVNIYTGEQIGSPKTDSGRRVVRFLPELIPHLKLCSRESFTYNMLRLYFTRLFKRLGIVKCSLHTMRHTFMTLCAYVGIAPKYIQKLAGHASIVTTFDIYIDAPEPGYSPFLDYFEKFALIYPKVN